MYASGHVFSIASMHNGLHVLLCGVMTNGLNGSNLKSWPHNNVM